MGRYGMAGVLVLGLMTVGVAAAGQAEPDGSGTGLTRATPTSATSASGELTIEALVNQARHLHGGPPANLGHARVRVTHTGAEPVPLALSRVEYLTGRSCEEPPSEVHAELRPSGLFAGELGMTESVEVLPLPPGAALELHVGFTRVEAYYNFCERFAFRLTFDAGGEALVVVAETDVTRVEPRR
jgi:hypothetical protein